MLAKHVVLRFHHAGQRAHQHAALARQIAEHFPLEGGGEEVARAHADAQGQAALLGAASVRLWQDQLLYKPPGGPAETTIGWHQDWASWDTVASHAAFVTGWVAFDDVDDDNGAMQIIPASHTWGLVPGASNFFGTDRDAQLARLGDGRAVESRSIVLCAGQVSFHHPLTFHGSGPNTSDRMRRSLAIHFVDAEVSAVSEPGIWQHYNLALFLERGGVLGERYRFDDLCPTVFAQ